MKKMPVWLFPVLFSLSTVAFFLYLYEITRDSPGMTSAWMVFLTALGWSLLIVLGQIPALRLKAIFAAAAVLLASVSLVEIFPPFPIDSLQHRLMVILQALGMAGIMLYLHILKKKEEHHHD